MSMNRSLVQFRFISSWLSALVLLFIAFHHEEYAVAFLHHPIKCRSRTRIRSNHNGNHGQTRSRCMESHSSSSNNDDDNVVTKFDIGVCNIPGVDWQRPNKVNQDSSFVDTFAFQLADDDNDNDGHSHEYTVIGVLDGHGKHGQDISTFAAQHMPREVYNQLLALATSTSTSAATESLPKEIVEYETKSITNLAGFDCSQFKSSSSCCANNAQTHQRQQHQVALINAFHLVHYNAMCDESVRSGRNGATCITCLIDHNNTNECTVAYVGDSRAILIHSNDDNDDVDNDSNHPTSSNSNNRNTTISVIAREQTVDLPEERHRIESREGNIRGKNVFYGPVGIAMTRSLGNAVMIRAGVIPTPMVDTIQLVYCSNNGEEEERDPTITSPTPATLVLATDGVWDVLSNEQVEDICSRHLLAQDAADAIAKIARERWVGDLPIMDEVKADDITIMVVKL